MFQPHPVNYLQPGEEPILTRRRHPRSIIVGAVTATLVWVAFLAASRWVFHTYLAEDLQPFWWNLAGLATFLWLLNLGTLFYRMRTSRYVVTEERVYRGQGRLRFQLLQTTYDKVTDLHVQQGPFGRLWGYGEVTVMTAGTGLTLQGVPDPFGMKKEIETARTAFLNHLIEEYRLHKVVPKQEAQLAEDEAQREVSAGTAGAVVGPGGAGDATSEPEHEQGSKEAVWRGRPVLVSVVAAAIRGLFLLMVGVAFLLFAMARDESVVMWFIAAAALFIGASTLIGGWVQYRFTRYEVHDWGVVVTSGWLTRRRVEVTFDKVTDVVTYQGFMGRIFNFGNITVNTAGSNQAPVTFAALDDPEEVKDVINETRRQRAEARRRSG